MQTEVVRSTKYMPTRRIPQQQGDLCDVVDLSLRAGQLLLQYGAEGAVVEETAQRLGAAFGAEREDVLISPNALIISTVINNACCTRVRRVVRLDVNYTIISAVNQLSRDAEAGKLDRSQVCAELQRISESAPYCNRWLTALMVGFSCAAFSQLFGGDWPVFGVTMIASTLAMLLRQELDARNFNALLVTIVTAFVAGLVASSATIFQLSPHGETAMIAAVLLLVPGVPLINAVEDIIKGHAVLGIVRAATGCTLLLGIALGLLLAIGVTGLGSL